MPTWSGAGGIPWDIPGVIPGHQGWRTSVPLRQQAFEPGTSVLLPVPLLPEALVFIPEGSEQSWGLVCRGIATLPSAPWETLQEAVNKQPSLGIN